MPLLPPWHGRIAEQTKGTTHDRSKIPFLRHPPAQRMEPPRPAGMYR